MQKISRKQFLLLAAGLSALGLAACGGTEPENTADSVRPGGDSSYASDPTEGAMRTEEFEQTCSRWVDDAGNRLELDLDNAEYTCCTWYGRSGRGTLDPDENGLRLLYQSCRDGENAYYFIREEGGFRVRHVNGSEDPEWGELNGLTFAPEESDAPLGYFDVGRLEGTWQNALGHTLAFNTALMRVIICSPGDEETAGTMGSYPIYDYGGGCGPFLGGEELLFPGWAADGNSFVLFAEGNEPRQPGARSVGVYYRDGAVEQYAEPEAACFVQDEQGRLWFADGVQLHALPEGYTLGGDGIACNQVGEAFPTAWPAENERYDPASVWGENWMEENWGSNG